MDLTGQPLYVFFEAAIPRSDSDFGLRHQGSVYFCILPRLRSIVPSQCVIGQIRPYNAKTFPAARDFPVRLEARRLFS